MEDMTTRSLEVRIETVATAPNYTEDTPLLKATKVIVVQNGTIEGKPTVDIQLKDDQGNEYVVMATGAIISMLGKVVEEQS